MGKFILGIIFTIVVVGIVGYLVATMGFVDMRADQKPAVIEARIAGHAMDASVERHAPGVKNPLQPTEADLRDGMHTYKQMCAVCHGDPKQPTSMLGGMEYPPAPQFVQNAADMPENQNFYIIQHGVRWTAMPGWGKMLNEQETWKVVSFLSNMEKLPPAVDQEWKSAASPAPAKSETPAKPMHSMH